MSATTVCMSDLSKRGSWSPRDFLYEPGRKVTVGGRRAIVARQEGKTVWLSFVEHVPGRRGSEFCCSLPTPFAVFEIDVDRRS